MKQDYNSSGIAYELLFASECLKRGLNVLKPVLASSAFDLVVMCNGSYFQVQVKHVTSLSIKDGREKCYTVANRQSTGAPCYFERGVDVIAIYVEPTRRWHLVAARNFTGNLIRIYRDGKSEASSSFDRWSIFHELSTESTEEQLLP